MFLIGGYSAYLFVNDQSQKKEQKLLSGFSSITEEHSHTIENLLSGNHSYIQQVIDNRLEQKKLASNDQSLNNVIIWSNYYRNLDELVSEYGEVCSVINIKKDTSCIKTLSSKLTKYHLVINELDRKHFFQYHLYILPNKFFTADQPVFIIKINMLNALSNAMSGLSSTYIRVSLDEKISGFGRKYTSGINVTGTPEIIILNKPFNIAQQQWTLNYSVSGQYPHFLSNFDHLTVLGIVIILFISVFIALIVQYFVRFHALADKNQINVLKLTEINKITGIGYWEWDIQTTQISWSKEIYNIFDMSRSEGELTYEQFLSRVHPEDRDFVTDAVNAALKNEKDYDIEHRILNSVGNIVYVQEKGVVTFDQTGNPVRMMGTVQDITLNKQVQNKLILSNKELEHVVAEKTVVLDKVNKRLEFERDRAQKYLDVANVILLVMDGAGTILLINKKGQEVLGYSENELLGENWFQKCLPLSCRELVQEEFYSCVKNKENFPEFFENQIITRQENIRHIAWRNTIIRSDFSEDVLIMSSGTDETELKQTMELLGNKQQSLNTFIESDLIGVIGVSSEGIILSVNQFICRVTGYIYDDLINKHFSYLLLANIDAKSWFNFHSTTQGEGFSLTMKNKNSQLIYTQVFLKPVFKTSGQLKQYLCLVVDVTSKIKENALLLEQERKQKKALIREVHHRIKNHLQGVMGLIENQELEHPEVKDILEKSRMQISSLALTYGIQSGNDNGEIYLCDLIKASVKFFQQVFIEKSQNIVENFPVKKDLLLVEEQAVPISLIINELLMNAIKHSSESSAVIIVSVSIDDKKAIVKIENKDAQLPKGFDFENNMFLGTGLELVKMLMPENVTLQINNIDSRVVAEMELK